MRIGNSRFVPKLWASATYLVVLGIMLWLGNWQLNRAALKVSMQEAASAAAQSAPVDISTVENVQAAAEAYARVTLRGTYDPERQLLWDNRTHKGRAGYEVISLIRLDGGKTALVNRGWVDLGASRQSLPDVALPDTAVGSPLIIEGFLSAPSKGFASGEALPEQGDWPRVLQYFDYDAIEGALGEPIVPAVLQLQKLSADMSSSTVLTSRPEFLTANWQPAASGPAKHYSYAFQWFAMAVGLTVIFLVVNRKKVRQHNDNEPGVPEPNNE